MIEYFGKRLVQNGCPGQECSKLVIAKILGYTSIVTASFVRLPQIWLLIKSESAIGIETKSLLVEFIILATSWAYGHYLELPISSYGDNVPIMIEIVIILVMALHLQIETHVIHSDEFFSILKTAFCT